MEILVNLTGEIGVYYVLITFVLPVASSIKETYIQHSTYQH